MTDVCIRADCAAARATLDDLRVELARAQARRTLGGTARPTTEGWANLTPPPPPSKTDPNAPEHRRAGMASSRPPASGESTAG